MAGLRCSAVVACCLILAMTPVYGVAVEQHTRRPLQTFDAFTDSTPPSATTTILTPSKVPSKKPEPEITICIDPVYKMDTVRFDVSDFGDLLATYGLDPELKPQYNQTYLLATSEAMALRFQQLNTSFPPAILTAIARTHVLAAPAGYKEFSRGRDSQRTLQGDTLKGLGAPLSCSVKGPVILNFFLTQENEYVVEAPGSSASVLGPHDIPICRRNKIHVVDDLLFPCCFTIASLRAASNLAAFLPASTTSVAKPVAAPPKATLSTGAKAGKTTTTTTTTATTKKPAAASLNVEAVLTSVRSKIVGLMQKDKTITAAMIPTVTTIPGALAAFLARLNATELDKALTRLAKYHVTITPLKLRHLVSGEAIVSATTLQASNGFSIADATAGCTGLLAVSFDKIPTTFGDSTTGATYTTKRVISIKADNSTATALSHYHLCGGQVLYFVNQVLIPCDLSTDPEVVPVDKTPVDPITGDTKDPLGGGPLGAGNSTYINPLGLGLGKSSGGEMWGVSKVVVALGVVAAAGVLGFGAGL